MASIFGIYFAVSILRWDTHRPDPRADYPPWQCSVCPAKPWMTGSRIYTFVQSKAHGVDLYQLILLGSSRMRHWIDKGSLPEPASSPECAEMFRRGVDILVSH
ncbi:hypothetical protein [Endozoicomonas sp. YOMI1]|uniref:hypothetical protein n=1 Tax=Endozoicomonas sp. YOMI1 TaxID=2828739 RepID=UPI00214748F4|nr:hypothetical protein [Endozoicomonas sp. YOMI1]